MEDRYSYAKEGPRPCGICGGIVHERLVKGQQFVADSSQPLELERVCQNPRCNSNTGQMFLGDVV